MKIIETTSLETIHGGAKSTNTQLQTALTGVTSALDSLKQNQGSSMNQLLPVIVMAKWMQNR
jgi:hypothetical protein